MIKQTLKNAFATIPYKPQIFTVLRPFIKSERVSKHLHFTDFFTVRWDGPAFKLYHCGDSTHNEIFWRGLASASEPTSLEVWRRLVPSCQNDSGLRCAQWPL